MNLASIPESQILDEITYPYIYVPHLEGSGTTIHDRSGTLPDKTLQGTTGGTEWNELHNGFTNQGDNYVLYNGDGEDAVIDTSTGNRRLLISYWILTGQAPNTSEYVFSAGAINNANEALGGFAVRAHTNGRPMFNWRWQVADGSGAGLDVLLMPSSTPSNGVLHHILFDIDLGGTVGGSVYVDGVLSFTRAEFDTTDKADGFPIPDRLVMGGKFNSPSTYDGFINGATTPSNSRYHSMFIGRPPTVADGGATGQTIASDLYKRKGGLGRSLIA